MGDMGKIMVSMHKKTLAFSLVEMAIVLVILGLLLGGAMALIGPQREVQKVKETEAEIQRIQDALIAFAIRSPMRNLPCPDNDQTNPGAEGPRNLVTGFCQNNEGWVPFAELGGVGRADAWGNRFRYRVIPSYSRSLPPSFEYDLAENISPAGTGETLNICTSTAANPTCTLPPTVPMTNVVATNVVAVIISHGSNGLGARSINPPGNLQSLPGSGTDEFDNTDGRNPADTSTFNTPVARRFISHEPRQAGGVGGQFDDVVGWIPQGLFHSKMLAASKLP